MKARYYYSTAFVHRIIFLAFLYAYNDCSQIQHIEQEELVNGGIIFG